MNYKSAQNHEYVLNSKFLRKLCFAKTCIIRAVTRNIHMQQVIISATSHVLTIKDLSKLMSLYIKIVNRFQVYRSNVVRKSRFREKWAFLNQCTSVTLYVSIHKIRDASNISKYRLLQTWNRFNNWKAHLLEQLILKILAYNSSLWSGERSKFQILEYCETRLFARSSLHARSMKPTLMIFFHVSVSTHNMLDVNKQLELKFNPLFEKPRRPNLRRFDFKSPYSFLLHSKSIINARTCILESPGLE